MCGGKCGVSLITPCVELSLSNDNVNLFLKRNLNSGERENLPTRGR